MNLLRAIRRRLGRKLFLSYLIVVGMGVVTLAAAVELSIPRSFDRHLSSMQAMMRGQGPMPMDMGDDLLTGFRSAVTESLLTAGVVAGVMAVAVSLFVSRRVVEPVREMTLASQRVAEGEYRERVAIQGSPDPDEMDELAQLAVSFNQMAAKLDRVEAMRRQLIGDVAHELRTPLTTIKGSMEGLIDGVIEPGPEAYHQIYLEADRLEHLVGDLQELSRAEAGQLALELQEVGAGKLIREAVDRVSLQFEDKGVQLGMDVAPNLPLVHADPDRIGQVLLNLIGNALQFTDVGGEVSVAARPQDEFVKVSVSDSGVGIAPEHLPHIFDRFYRVDKSRSRASGGSGIGLTIAKHIIIAHGGEIWAESDGLGNGSTFSFTLRTAGGSE